MPKFEFNPFEKSTSPSKCFAYEPLKLNKQIHPLSYIENNVAVQKSNDNIDALLAEHVNNIILPKTKKTTIQKRMTSFNLPLTKGFSTHIWSTQQWFEDKTHMGQFVPMEYIDPYVRHMCKSIRKLAEKQRIYDLFQLDIKPKEIKLPIEEQLLSRLSSALQVRIQREVRVGPYRLDAILPDWGIAISIKEKDHSGYDADEEKQRETFIRQKYNAFLPFNAHQDVPKQFLSIDDMLIAQVHQLITSRMMTIVNSKE